MLLNSRRGPSERRRRKLRLELAEQCVDIRVCALGSANQSIIGKQRARGSAASGRRTNDVVVGEGDARKPVEELAVGADASARVEGERNISRRVTNVQGGAHVLERRVCDACVSNAVASIKTVVATLKVDVGQRDVASRRVSVSAKSSVANVAVIVLKAGV